MDFTITVGSVELSFTPSASTSKDTSTAPKITTSGGDDLEKIVELFNFSGKIKVISKQENDEFQTMSRVGAVATATAATTQSSSVVVSGGPTRKNKGFGLELLRGMKQRDGNNNNNKNNDGDGGITKPEIVEKMTTPLHISCGSMNPKVAEMETILNSNPIVVFIPDNEGKLPIHHLSCNERILQNVEAKKKVEAFANRLLSAYPKSIVEKDNIGHIPFVHSIMKWIDCELGRKGEGVLTAPQLITGLHPFFTVFPSDVTISPAAEWSIMMLTTAMDSQGGEIFDKIAHAVASIAFFVKTVLLIQCINTRHKIMATSLFKRVIIDRRTAGLWLIPMLSAGGCLYAGRCIDYFNFISAATVAQFIGRKRKVNPSDMVNFQNAQIDVFNRIGQSNHFIPSLCLLSGDEKERAGKTKVIRHIIDAAVSDKFVNTLFCNDILMLISLMISFRIVSFNNGVMATIPPSRILYEEDKLFKNQKKDLTLCLLICSYFYMRKASQSISIISISKRLFLSTLFMDWSVQITSITMALVSSIMLMSGTYKDMSLQLAITMGLLWLTLIYLLQRVLKPVFLFTISAKQILKNLYWFWLLLAISVFMFGDMMHIYTTNNGSCSRSYDPNSNNRNLVSQSRSDTFSTGFQGDVVMTSPYIEDNPSKDSTFTIAQLFKSYEEEDPYCSSNIAYSYGTTFIIMLGQFEQHLYTENNFMFYTSLIFAFLIVIFFLTMLVTLIAEEYEKNKEKAEDIFGRCRINFAAEQVMLGNSILRSKFSDINVIQKVIFIYHWIVLVFVFAVFATMCYYNYLIVAQYEDEKINENELPDYHGLYGTETSQLIVIIVQMLCLGINELLLFDTIVKFYAAEDGKVIAFRNFIATPLSVFFSATQGLSSAFIKVTDQDDDNGRMINFERSTNAIVSESEKRICKIVAASEQRILDSEEEMKYVISGIVENVVTSKKKNDDDSSSDSSGSSHVTFTRADLNLPLPC